MRCVKSHPHGCVSWNVTIKLDFFNFPWSHPHGCVSWNFFISRQPKFRFSHTLTGVWVEMTIFTVTGLQNIRHTLTGVWVEIQRATGPLQVLGHTLTGVWVEICQVKHNYLQTQSHPHGCVSWNSDRSKQTLYDYGHTLTGVWVEIPIEANKRCTIMVTPSRVCELKFR